MKIFKGLFNGEVKEIKVNEKGTYYYVDGKRISKDEAIKAVKAYEEATKNVKEIGVAINIANDGRDVKENTQESQEKVSSEIGANLKEMVISVQDLRDVIDYIFRIVETKSVKEKINLYNNAPALVRWFINLARTNYRVGAYYKRFVKDAKDFGIKPVESNEINLYQLRKVLDELTENNQIKKVVLTKEEFEKLASVIPMLDQDLGEKFFLLLNGRVKLEIPKKFI